MAKLEAVHSKALPEDRHGAGNIELGPNHATTCMLLRESPDQQLRRCMEHSRFQP